MGFEYATVEKTAAGFKAAAEKINTLEVSQGETRKTIDELSRRLRDFNKALLHRPFIADGNSGAFWRSEEDAKAFGEIVFAVAKNKALATGDIGAGGALVPVELRAQLIDKIQKYGKFRANATVFPMGAGDTLFPKIDSDLVVYCPGQGNEIDESDIGFGQISMIARAWCALAVASNELSEDSIVGLGEIFGLSFARSLAKQEDSVGFCGDATADYFGMAGIIGALRAVALDIADIAGLKVGSGNAYSELTLDDFREVIGLLPPDVDSTAKWYCHKRFYFSVIWKLAEAAGVANIFEILSDRKDRFFFGYPVEFVHCLPFAEANSQICCLLGDLKLGCYLGERKQMTIEQNPGPFFMKNQIAIRGVERIAINCFGVGDKTEPGPIVGLITAAS